MKRRYSILVREFGSKHEVELLQVDGNPDPIAYALEQKCWGDWHHINKYSSVRIVDHGRPPDDVVADDALPPWAESP